MNDSFEALGHARIEACPAALVVGGEAFHKKVDPLAIASPPTVSPEATSNDSPHLMQDWLAMLKLAPCTGLPEGSRTVTLTCVGCGRARSPKLRSPDTVSDPGAVDKLQKHPAYVVLGTSPDWELQLFVTS